VRPAAQKPAKGSGYLRILIPEDQWSWLVFLVSLDSKSDNGISAIVGTRMNSAASFVTTIWQPFLNPAAPHLIWLPDGFSQLAFPLTGHLPGGVAPHGFPAQ
jgi:hypothetical protein